MAGVLRAVITDHAGTTEALFTNTSATCSFPIGLASYRRFDGNIDNQELYDYRLAIIPPNSTLVLTVNNPPCAYQADAFYGDLLYSFAGGVRYGERLLDDTKGNGNNYCTTQCPGPIPPTNTPTHTPTRTPTSVPPTWTNTPTHTPTSVPPTLTRTAMPPTLTQTAVPPTLTLTAVPPTLTQTAVPPTLTPTAVPPTLTQTAVPPTLTATAVPPTLTQTAVPPTLTATAVPPTLTRTAVPPTLTATAVPPTLTRTAVPPTLTATGTATPVCAVAFNDVPPDHPFYAFIRCLVCRGVVSGYPCGGPNEPCPGSYYRPDANLTRGQVAKIIANSAGFGAPVPQDQQTFADVPAGHVFWLWIERLAGTGIINGYPCGAAGEPCDPQSRPYFRPATR